MPETKKKKLNEADMPELVLVRRNAYGQGFDLFFPLEACAEGRICFWNAIDGHGEADIGYLHEMTSPATKDESRSAVASYEALIRTYPGCAALTYAPYVSLPRSGRASVPHWKELQEEGY